MTNIEELIKKANNECKRIKNHIVDNRGMFDSMTLKLYTACEYGCKGMEEDFPLCYADNQTRKGDWYFYMFCEWSYDQFLEWCISEGIDFSRMAHYIGRSSQFYLYLNELVHRRRGRIDWSLTMCNISDLGDLCLVEFDEHGLIDLVKSSKSIGEYDIEEEWEQEFKLELEYIISKMYDDFLNEIKDVDKVYGYIKDFKDNQVKYFKAYLSKNEAALQDEKNRENAEAAKRAEIIEKMPEGIRSAMKRSALNSEDLNEVLSCILQTSRTN
jgi:hypothetical protein